MSRLASIILGDFACGSILDPIGSGSCAISSAPDIIDCAIDIWLKTETEANVIYSHKWCW